MSVPEGSCSGTGNPPIASSVAQDGAGRPTGICPDCQGRFRLDVDGLVPNHAPARPRR